jgi:hypothetical protein
VQVLPPVQVLPSSQFDDPQRQVPPVITASGVQAKMRFVNVISRFVNYPGIKNSKKYF